MRKPSLLVIFLSVFIDLIGFGIVLPLLPRYSEKFGAEGLTIGLIISSFSLMQFFCAPWWGRLSDRIGRRPVLLISNAGAAVSYALFALAAWPGLSRWTALGMLLLSRVFAGACGANISVASAYIADITPAEGRSKGMALIGVSFGLGFILGPALGALSASAFGLAGPGWVAASFCAGNFILGWFILGESRTPTSQHAQPRPKLAQWSHTLSQPKLGLLIGVYFLATFCFVCFESTLPLLLGSPSFHPDDFRQPRALAGQLLHGTDPASVYLRTQLSPGFRQTLGEAEGTPVSRLRREFFVEFNVLIKSAALFPAETRAHLTLRPGTERLSGHLSRGEAQVHLNRLILEDAYPAMIAHQDLYFDEKHIGYLFAYCGLVSTLIQGGVIGRLVKRLGEARLIFGSLLVVAVSLVVIPYAPQLSLAPLLPGGGAPSGAWHWFLQMFVLLASLGLFSIGSGVNRAPTMGLISLNAPAAEQGATLGVAQSAGTLARIVGPVFATGLYAVFPHAPYLVAAAVSLVAGLVVWRFLCHPPAPQAETEAGLGAQGDRRGPVPSD